MTRWRPEIPSDAAPLYLRLADAMERDIGAGTLPAGMRLPPQRDLAHQLGLSIGTVTRAYAEAERRGLLDAHVGRGSFVRGSLPDLTAPSVLFHAAHPAADPETVIDLRCNTPPAIALSRSVELAVTRLAATAQLEPSVQYIQGTGLRLVREAGAAWLARRHGLACDPDDLIQCNGGQHAIGLVLSSLCRPGDTVLCESSTFHGAKVAAEHLGLTLRGVTMDQEGLDPAALDRVLAETRARLLFTLPTLHNPTTRSMSLARREAIVRIARRHDVTIFEDDAYCAYADPGERPPPIAALAPERTLYLASISKGVCPGLRLAFVTLPPAMPRERLMRGIRAFGYCPPALGGLIFAHWVAEGTADAVADAVQAEAAHRLEMARRILGCAMDQPGARHAPHIWLPLAPLQAERVMGRAARAGVELTPPEASIVSRDAASGLRVCLGAAGDRATLERALTILHGVIRESDAVRTDSVV